MTGGVIKKAIGPYLSYSGARPWQSTIGAPITGCSWTCTGLKPLFKAAAMKTVRITCPGRRRGSVVSQFRDPVGDSHYSGITVWRDMIGIIVTILREHFFAVQWVTPFCILLCIRAGNSMLLPASFRTCGFSFRPPLMAPFSRCNYTAKCNKK